MHEIVAGNRAQAIMFLQITVNYELKSLFGITWHADSRQPVFKDIQFLKLREKQPHTFFVVLNS